MLDVFFSRGFSFVGARGFYRSRSGRFSYTSSEGSGVLRVDTGFGDAYARCRGRIFDF